MSHPRIEEVSDSDGDVSDPSEGDIDDFDDADIMRRVDAATTQRTPQQQQTPSARGGPAQHQHDLPMRPAQQQPPGTVPQAQYAGFQCLYPVYFDASRSRAEGRRVPRSQAVANPLAAEIAQACGALRLQPVFEPTKTHPRDWANPGRVRVSLKRAASSSPAAAAAAARIRNKHHLFVLVARHLRDNPTREDGPSLRAVAVPGLPNPAADKPWPRPAVPRGWKMGELLPHYSPALTGGGVSENFLQDVMKEMQQGGAGGRPADMASALAAAAAGGSGSGGGAGASGGGGRGGGAKKGKGKR